MFEVTQLIEPLSVALTGAGGVGIVAVLLKRRGERRERWAELSAKLDQFGDKYGASVFRYLSQGRRIKALDRATDYVELLRDKEERVKYFKDRAVNHVRYLNGMEDGNQFATEVLKALPVEKVKEFVASIPTA